jgi:hypothetical protein
MKTKEELQLLLNAKIKDYDLLTLAQLALQNKIISFKEYIQISQTIDAPEFTNTNTGYYYGGITSSGYGRKSEDLIVVGHREINDNANALDIIKHLIKGYNRLAEDKKFPMISIIENSHGDNEVSLELRIGW